MISLESLPHELLYAILGEITGRDLVHVRLVNHRLYGVCSDPDLWESRLQADFPWLQMWRIRSTVIHLNYTDV